MEQGIIIFKFFQFNCTRSSGGLPGAGAADCGREIEAFGSQVSRQAAQAEK